MAKKANKKSNSKASKPAAKKKAAPVKKASAAKSKPAAKAKAKPMDVWKLLASEKKEDHVADTNYKDLSKDGFKAGKTFIVSPATYHQFKDKTENWICIAYTK